MRCFEADAEPSPHARTRIYAWNNYVAAQTARRSRRADICEVLAPAFFAEAAFLAKLSAVKERHLVEIDVKHGGRVTHKIIGELNRDNWLTTEKQEGLKEQLFAMALSHNWVLEGREIGDLGRTGFMPEADKAFLAADDRLGVILWQIVTM